MLCSVVSLLEKLPDEYAYIIFLKVTLVHELEMYSVIPIYLITPKNSRTDAKIIWWNLHSKQHQRNLWTLAVLLFGVSAYWAESTTLSEETSHYRRDYSSWLDYREEILLHLSHLKCLVHNNWTLTLPVENTKEHSRSKEKGHKIKEKN